MKKLKKKRTIGLVIGLIGFLAVVLGGLLGQDNNNLGNGIIMFIGIPALLVGICVYLNANGKLMKICENCGESMSGCAYEYQEISRNFNGQSMTYLVNIRATCPHCGMVKVIKKKFSCANGQNIEYKVDEFCRKKFDH